MSVRDDILGEILAEAEAVPTPAAPAKKHRFRRLTALAVTASSAAVVSLMFFGPASPASASCSNWSYPDHVPYSHSKTCNLAIADYNYFASYPMGQGVYCYDFHKYVFTCAEWYDLGLVMSCR